LIGNDYYCYYTVSNEVPESPVISPVSGGVFEKRLIEKLLGENGSKDPINGESLLPEQLIEIKSKCSVLVDLLIRGGDG
jgi:pre-mRNA-processing factor 19